MICSHLSSYSPPYSDTMYTLEGITRKELDAYLKGEEPETPAPAEEPEEVGNPEEDIEDELPEDYFDVDDEF